MTDPSELAKLFPKRERKPITNYDALLRRSVSSLAEIFSHLCCPNALGGDVKCNIENKGCYECWYEWLNLESKDKCSRCKYPYQERTSSICAGCMGIEK